MSRLSGLAVTVAGSGAVGLVTALTLQGEGARVTLADPAALGDNASGVAAGMLAPAFESVLDSVSAGHFPLLEAARDAWPVFLETQGLPDALVDRCGALWIGDEASNSDVQLRLRALGANVETVGGREAAELSPGVRAPQGGVFTAEDWRLDPGAVLGVLIEAFAMRGGRLVREAVIRPAPNLVLATGLPPKGFRALLPEREALSPVKGQIARFAGEGPFDGPAVRGQGIYLSPSAFGVIAGATMEPGASDRDVEPAAIRRLVHAAATLVPHLEGKNAKGSAGVRAATPDGLPLVGPATDQVGLFLALGARRNGWLLAPLIAGVVADALAGAPSGPWARPFDPGRFNPEG